MSKKRKPKRGKDGRFKAVTATTITKKGYVRITAGPQRGMYLHRLLAAFKKGAPLTKDEDSHHVDGNKLNFGYENLQVLGHREHGCVSSKQRYFLKERDIKLKGEWDAYFDEEAQRLDIA